MNKKSLRRLALIGAASSALVVSLLTPAQAARGTVIVHDTNPLTGFNSSVVGFNLVTNSNVGYLSGMGFGYYDDKKRWIQNTTFGSYKIVSNKSNDFRVQYTVNPGRLWSDGTPITGVDLLLSHVICSPDYAKEAGLGETTATRAFNASCYSGIYGTQVAGDPILSSDKMSVTVRYKKRFPDWWLYGPGPSPVHTLVHLADTKTGLQSVASNEKARDAFEKAFSSKDTATLKDLGKVWSTAYNLQDVNAATTNPLLWVGNGGFLVSSAIKNQSVTMKANPRYNSGPAVTGSIDNVVWKFVADGNPAIQALANGEIDIYNGQVTADGLASLRKISSVTVVPGIASTYEHWDPRVGNTPGEPAYTGIFAGYSAKATDLRRAFLLCVPREEIVTKLIAPINPDIPVLRSVAVTPDMDIYNDVIRANGSAYYVGAQDSLNKRGLALVRKYVPNALNNPIKVSVLVPGNNARRAAEFELVKANARKCGFDLVGDVQAAWPGLTFSSKYDVNFFGWASTSTAQAALRANWYTDLSNNRSGFSDPEMNRLLDELANKPMSEKVKAQTFIKVERILNDKGLTLPVFQFPAVLAYNKDIKGVKLAPLSPTTVWNFWEWSY